MWVYCRGSELGSLVFFPVFPGAKRVSRRGSILSWLSPFGPALRQDIWDGKCPFFPSPLLLFVSLSPLSDGFLSSFLLFAPGFAAAAN